MHGSYFVGVIIFTTTTLNFTELSFCVHLSLSPSLSSLSSLSLLCSAGTQIRMVRASSGRQSEGMYVCIRMYVYLYVYVYVCISHVCMYICIYIYIYMCVCVCVWLCSMCDSTGQTSAQTNRQTKNNCGPLSSYVHVGVYVEMYM